MEQHHPSGLGEILRHLVEIVDRGSLAHYRENFQNFSPRYTPIMRALAQGSCSISEITKHVYITQGAVSQTVILMEKKCLVKRELGKDARQSIVSLTAEGNKLLASLQKQWGLRFLAIEGLEQELGYQLREELERVVDALHNKSFYERLVEVECATQQEERFDA